MCPVNAGSSVVTDVPFSWGVLVMGEVHMCGVRGYMNLISVPSTQSCCEPKTTLNKKKEEE